LKSRSPTLTRGGPGLLVPSEKTKVNCAKVISVTKGIQKFLPSKEASWFGLLGVVVWADDMVLFSARIGNRLRRIGWLTTLTESG
jgi:hypothetical protein